MAEPSRLSRRLNTRDAVIIGLGSMIGAGIFAAAGPATEVAGSGVLLSLFVAGFIAYLNATTMAQLAALYPESGGTYVYGRKQLGHIWGFLAGWGFIVGKLASCAAMALTFAYYGWPQNPRPIAMGIVALLAFVNYCGIKKTVMATRILVLLVLLTLAIVVIAAFFGNDPDPSRLAGGLQRGGVLGVFQGAGFLFFAFAGYARIATLGEEVLEPRVTIPKAILTALAITLGLYTVVIGVTLVSLDIKILAGSNSPLLLAVQSGGFAAFSPFVKVGACLASMSVLLSLMAGIGRTIFAMAAQGDLPGFLSAVHPRHKVPHRAEMVVALIVILFLGLADLRTAIGFSSFSILVYYAIANAASLTLRKDQRLWPPWMGTLGLISCLAVAYSLPVSSIVSGSLVFLLGLAVQALKKKFF